MAAMALQDKIDSARFSETTIDNTIKSQMEGGYVHTRKRHTRPQLRKFTVGFTAITEADRQTFITFYNTVETHSIFEFTHPVTNVVYSVRFDAPVGWKYEGAGLTAIWSSDDIVLNQV